MSRTRQADILVELTELCQELSQEISHQLVYYRASVYKDETSHIVQTKVNQLRTISKLLNEEMLSEVFADFDALTANAHLHYVPGECSYSNRISHLLKSFEQALAEIRQVAKWNRGNAQLTKNVQKHRRQLLSICRQGSRQWTFFKSL